MDGNQQERKSPPSLLAMNKRTKGRSPRDEPRQYRKKSSHSVDDY
jgi:hypothetical protein